MILRHLYNLYKSLDIKAGLFAVSWMRMTSFYFFYPAEYICTIFLMLAALPYAKTFSSSSEYQGAALNLLRMAPV
jgi:hypothetical protein